MKRVYVNQKWCLGCHLCEYHCAFANSGQQDMARALRGKTIHPRIHVEGAGMETYPVACRHCTDPLCVKSCISGALSVEDGVICLDRQRCVGCLTCVLVCPFGALARDEAGAVIKCELCVHNSREIPACVQGCPNRAIVYEER